MMITCLMGVVVAVSSANAGAIELPASALNAAQANSRFRRFLHRKEPVCMTHLSRR
jgi:hypothetical protein